MAMNFPIGPQVPLFGKGDELYFSDMLETQVGVSSTVPWQHRLVSSATVSQSETDGNRPGIVRGVASATASCGVHYSYNATAANYNFLILSADKTVTFEAGAMISNVLTTARIGLGVGTNTISDWADGVYFEKLGTFPGTTTIVGKTARASSRSSTSSYTLSMSSWYSFQIVASSQRATFNIYDSTGDNLLWSESLTANIPLVGCGSHFYGFMTEDSQTGGEIFKLDYLALAVNPLERNFR